MPFLIENDYSPVYELYISLHAFIARRRHALLDLGKDWAVRVRHGLNKDFASRLARIKPESRACVIVPSLVWKTPPAYRQDIGAYLNWLASLPANDTFSLFQTSARIEVLNKCSDLQKARDQAVEVLNLWYEQYYRTVESDLAPKLAEKAELQKIAAKDANPEDFIEQLTFGLRMQPIAATQTVVLIPQYHFSPWDVYDLTRDSLILYYPANIDTVEPGKPSLALLRLTRALSDENRLRILRFLSEGQRSFSEVVRFSGLAKSTVHHHLVALRASGLVRILVADGNPGNPDRFTLRPGVTEYVSEQLSGFLNE